MDTEVRKPQVGGRRPGAGRKPIMVDAKRTMIRLEAEDKKTLTELAVYMQDRYPDLTVSEMLRRWLRKYPKGDRPDLASAVRALRPYLGQPRPKSGDMRRIFKSRANLTIYIPESEWERINEVVKVMNEGIIDVTNESLQFETEHAEHITASEVIRLAISDLLAEGPMATLPDDVEPPREAR